jgi:hypothetical protein
MLQGFKPNAHTDADITQRLSGGLSTLMALPGSDDEKKNAVQSCEPAIAAAE